MKAQADEIAEELARKEEDDNPLHLSVSRKLEGFLKANRRKIKRANQKETSETMSEVASRFLLRLMDDTREIVQRNNSVSKQND